MTTSLDGYNITIQNGSFHEKKDFSGKDQYVWKDSSIKLDHKSYGLVERWSFTCFEDTDEVAWADSVANKLLPVVASGAPVVFMFSSTKHSIPDGQTVCVNGVNVRYSSNLKIRYFDVNVMAI